MFWRLNHSLFRTIEQFCGFGDFYLRKRILKAIIDVCLLLGFQEQSYYDKI